MANYKKNCKKRFFYFCDTTIYFQLYALNFITLKSSLYNSQFLNIHIIMFEKVGKRGLKRLVDYRSIIVKVIFS